MDSPSSPSAATPTTPDSPFSEASGERFRLLMEHLADAVYLADADGRILSVNQAACEQLGYAREELVGMALWDIHAHGDQGTFRSHWRGQPDNRPQTITSHHRRRDGATFPVEVHAQSFRHQGRRLLLGVVRDVSRRRDAEEELRRQQTLLASTLEATADGILVVGNDGRVLMRNARFADMWRIPDDLLEQGDDETLLQHVLDQLQDPRAFLDKVQELYGSDATDLDTLRFADGRVFERFSAPLAEDGRVTGRVWSFRDVTEQKWTETALRESEKRYRTLFDQAMDMIALADADTGILLDVNQASLDLLGVPPEELIGRHQSELHPAPEHRPSGVTETFERHRGEATGQVLEARMVRADGAERDVAIKASRFRLGERNLILGIVHDITDYKRAEAILRQDRDELERRVQERTAELEDARRRAESSSEAKSRFLAAMSHELRTPMHAVLGMADLLASTDLDQEQQGYLQDILGSARQLMGQLDDVLDYARLDQDTLRLNRQHFDLARLLDSVLERHRPEANRKGLALSLELDPDVPRALLGDWKVFSRALGHLVHNAVKFTEQGSVSLRVSSRDACAPLPRQDLPTCAQPLAFAVRDTGPGIAPEMQERIFQGFTQGEDGFTRGHGGAGIGLALARGLARHLGGGLELDSAPGRGSTFTLTAPFEAVLDEE